MQELINKAIQKAASNILDFISMGWSKEAAIAEVCNCSTLGPKSWAIVLEVVEKGV